ncbi:hypothetical protein B0H10DRAFT_2084336 [Mycena sp. CBHHK59/15]|nr:hypothetical protein B0H10DRAFT_2084336 [Mycena sp. CBHHK59/15]
MSQSNFTSAFLGFFFPPSSTSTLSTSFASSSSSFVSASTSARPSASAHGISSSQSSPALRTRRRPASTRPVSVGKWCKGLPSVAVDVTPPRAVYDGGRRAHARYGRDMAEIEAAARSSTADVSLTGDTSASSGDVSLVSDPGASSGDVSLISDANASLSSAVSFNGAPTHHASFDIEGPTRSSMPELSFGGASDISTALDASLATTSSCDVLLINDICLTSDASASSDASPSHTQDAPLCLPPPRAIGLGLSGLAKHDGSPFDGLGVLSFGLASPPGADDAHPRFGGGLSRTFREEAARTWALGVILEGEQEDADDDGWAAQAGSTRRCARRPARDLSTAATVSSALKRKRHTTAAAPRAPGPAWRV